MSVTVLCW